MNVAYIAGPYRGKDPNEVWENIMKAREAARIWWLAGYAVICPHLNSMMMDGPEGETDHLFLEGDKELLRRSDVLVMLPEWERSRGATAEHALATKLGMRIIYMK